MMKINFFKPHQLLLYLFQLTGILFFWQILYLTFVGDGSTIIDIVMQKLFIVPMFVWFEIVAYWILQLLFYVFFALFIWAVTRFLSSRFSLSTEKMHSLGVWFWWLCVLLLFVANEIFYPNSAFGEIFFAFLPLWLAKVTLSLLLIIFFIAVFFAAYEAFLLFHKTAWFWLSIVVVVILILWGEIDIHLRIAEPVQVGRYQQPNVFIVGIDALRPDRIHFYGYSKSQTPNIDAFLKTSTNFRHAITVLARTSPAWASILTGQYPKNNGVRFNLVSQQNLKLQDSLGYILKRQGYETIYATDGRQFNFIDEDFGFDQVIGASGTVSNFIMNLIDDTPASDLISNTLLGRFLYPSIYGNRDISFTYQPKSFLTLVKEQMPKYVNKPIFMGIHFTLPHYPYDWTNPRRSANESNSALYDTAVQYADQQVGEFFNYLEEQHLLNNAVIVLLSDHGEALLLPGDRMLSRRNYIGNKKGRAALFQRLNALQFGNTKLNESAGHGTDVLSYSQYNSLLAFKAYGRKKVSVQTVNHLVALIDIKPTLLALLNLPKLPADGQSLMPYLNGESSPDVTRRIVTEIGFTPLSLKDNVVSVQNAILQSADVFAIEAKTHRIIMKPQSAQELLKTKQRAIYYKNWVLALYPEDNNILFPVLVNRQTGQWSDNLQTAFAKKSPAKMMLQYLKEFYEKEVTDYYHEDLNTANR